MARHDFAFRFIFKIDMGHAHLGHGRETIVQLGHIAIGFPGVAPSPVNGEAASTIRIFARPAFEGVVCNSLADICASNYFARRGLPPAPNTSRLKSRRFPPLMSIYVKLNGAPRNIALIDHRCILDSRPRSILGDGAVVRIWLQLAKICERAKPICLVQSLYNLQARSTITMPWTAGGGGLWHILKNVRRGYWSYSRQSFSLLCLASARRRPMKAARAFGHLAHLPTLPQFQVSLGGRSLQPIFMRR